MTTGRRIVSTSSLAEEAELPDHEVARLLAKATGRTRSGLARDPIVAEGEAARFMDLVARRRSGEPLQYIEGTSQFGPIEVAVDPRVLIPRPETEELWELVVDRLSGSAPKLIVDLGTGSGNLAIALKHAFPGATVHAVELSAAAFEVAAANVAACGLEVILHTGDLFSALPPELCGTVDVVISNPPYVATAERDRLPVEVRDHEPAVALFGGADGLAVLRRIITAAPRWLRPGGMLACEIGADQGTAVAALAQEMGPEIVKDLSGRDRFLIAQKGME